MLIQLGYVLDNDSMPRTGSDPAVLPPPRVNGSFSSTDIILQPGSASATAPVLLSFKAQSCSHEVNGKTQV